MILAVFELSIIEGDFASSCHVGRDPMRHENDEEEDYNDIAVKYSLVPQGQIQCQNDLRSETRVFCSYFTTGSVSYF